MADVTYIPDTNSQNSWLPWMLSNNNGWGGLGSGWGGGLGVTARQNSLQI